MNTDKQGHQLWILYLYLFNHFHQIKKFIKNKSDIEIFNVKFLDCTFKEMLCRDRRKLILNGKHKYSKSNIAYFVVGLSEF